MTEAEKLTLTDPETILRIAPSHQGGHSDVGMHFAEILGVPFPLRVPDLEKRARESNLDPYELWPWLKQIRRLRTKAGEG